MARHTPGPWTFFEEHTRPMGQRVVQGQSRILFHVPRGANLREAAEFEANGRLIAAAPDLLAACELWDQGFVEGEEFDADQFLAWVNANRRAARAAIAKALGHEAKGGAS